MTEEIRILAPGDPLWARAAAFARDCSWRAGPELARRMGEGSFLAWERVILALRGGEPAGFCTLSARDELPPDCTLTPFIGFVFVGEEHRGRRLSQRLLRAAADYAGSLGFGEVYLVSGEEGLYEKYGFRPLGLRRTVYGTEEQLFCLTLA